MNCIDCRKYIDEQLSLKRELPVLLPTYEQHITGCPLCEKYWQQAAITGFLHQVSDIEAPVDLEQRVLARVKQQQLEQTELEPLEDDLSVVKSKSGWHWGYSLAASLVVVSFAFWLIQSSSYLTSSSSTEIPEKTFAVEISLPVNQVSELPVMIESNQAYDNVAITVSIGPELSIPDYEGVRELSWQASLQQGANVIKLPIFVASDNEEVITVAVKSDKGTKDYRILVKGQQKNSQPIII